MIDNNENNNQQEGPKKGEINVKKSKDMKDWKKYRREDGSINLIEAWCDEQWPPFEYKEKAVIEFLQQIEEYQLIKSRQVAAMILAQADFNIDLMRSCEEDE